MTYYLHDEVRGIQLHIDQSVVLGRDHAHRALQSDEKLSRRHARVYRDADAHLNVEDLGSTNGTFVNGARIRRPQALRAGDFIQIGEANLEVRHATPGATPSPAFPIEQVGSPSALFAVPRVLATPTRASVLHTGKRLEVGPEGLTIGRDDDNDVVIDSPLVSRHHARIVPSDGRYYVVDLGSTNGTHLNGEIVVGESRWLNAGDAIGVGGEALRFLVGSANQLSQAPEWDPSTTLVRFDRPKLTIGRDPSNDIVLESPNVSRFHAEIVAADGGARVRDLGSRNGTRLDGNPVTEAILEPGSQISVGQYRLVFDGENFLQRDDSGALRLDADGVSVVVRGKQILNRASLTIQPGELVAIIGESGGGKTTLIKALAGVSVPTDGSVTVNGDPVQHRLTDLGYVPQEDIVHRRLTVRESLSYSARLRLPQDSSAADIDAAVGRTITDLGLDKHAETRIDMLSGGQRKRVSVATELLNRPGLLFLDEPTTGLDPGLETQLMELFRELAEVGKRAVVLVTHATKNLALADKLCVMGRGGEICFVGAPEEAKTFFGVDDYDEIYRALASTEPKAWRDRFDHRNLRAPAREASPVRTTPVRRPRRGSQGRILASRYLKVFLRDRRNVAILLAQVPLLGIATAFLFDRDVFRTGGNQANAASQLLFVLVTTTIWLGTLDAAREVIKERGVFERERAIGVRIWAYIASKLMVLWALVAIQSTILVLIVFVLRPAHEPVYRYFEVAILLWLTGFAAVSMGLLISSLVNTEDQATAIIPLAMIVQLLFGGAIVTVKNMGAVVGTFSGLTFERWSFSGIGTVLRMNSRIAADKGFGPHSPYSHSFFDLRLPLACSILFVFVAALTGASALRLRRRGT